MARWSKQFVDSLAWRLKALGAPKVQGTVKIWLNLRSWRPDFAQTSSWNISNPNHHNNPSGFILAGAATSSAFDPMDGYPYEGLAGHVGGYIPFRTGAIFNLVQVK